MAKRLTNPARKHEILPRRMRRVSFAEAVMPKPLLSMLDRRNPNIPPAASAYATLAGWKPLTRKVPGRGGKLIVCPGGGAHLDEAEVTL